MKRDGYHVMTTANTPLRKEVIELEMSVEAVEKSGYDYFMLKEIMEQPQSHRRLDARTRQRRGGHDHAGRTDWNGRDAAQRAAHHHLRVRHELACRAGRRVSDRRDRAHSGRGRVRIGVSLPRADPARGRRGVRDLAVRRNRRHASRRASGQAERYSGHRHRQHGRLDDRARDRRGRLLARRTRNRRGLDQGVHLAGNGSDHDRAQDGRGPHARRRADEGQTRRVGIDSRQNRAGTGDGRSDPRTGQTGSVGVELSLPG